MVHSKEVVERSRPEPLVAPSAEVANASAMARISALAADMPMRPAIVDGSLAVSFSELESRSNKLANYLLQIGLGAGATAALLLERSADFVIAALAVMKTGAAYVPLDSSIPADRASIVIADAQATLVLTHRKKADYVTGGAARIVELDGGDSVAISKQSSSAPSIDFSTGNLAYVVYTSGSTGRPKGCEITHGNLNCLIEWHQNAFGLTPADRASHVAGLGFDVVQWELWPNLTAGAAVHIADEVTRRSHEDLQEWILDQRITICFAPTVLAEQLLMAKWPASTALRWLLIGGESLHRRPSVDHPFSVANCYGPAECTVVSTSYRVPPGGSETPTIGRAIPRTSVLILDADLKPVPVGEPGELCLGGDHVGRGYRGNPELTSRQFVQYTPADGAPAVRIYRTGDRARELPNGEIVFMGRLDDQVKIRGYRIEPGEVSAWLDRHPAINKSVVIARDSGRGLELVAYVAAQGSQRPSLSELRSYLAAKVPEYMVPQQFVLLAALPTTVNGKTDRAALPAPDPSNMLADAIGGNDLAGDLETDLEKRVGGIIAALLGQPSVKGTDNFFMLGGHSMLGVQLVAKIRDTFGVKLGLRQLFGAPTINALCAEIRRQSTANPAKR
jgi:amino acid adenylation domain-containing protein